MALPIEYRGSLRPETAKTLIERAIARILCLAYQRRLTVSESQDNCRTVDELRAFPRAKIYDYSLRFVESVGRVYRFDYFSDAPDDGVDVIKPTDGTEFGRWLREGASADQSASRNIGVRNTAIQLNKWAARRTGFSKITRIWEGEYDEEAVDNLFSVKPAYVVLPYSITRESKSLIPGTYYREKYHYRVWGISQSLRWSPAALVGSMFRSEFTDDPGLNWVMGAARRALAGSTLGLLGVASTEIGDEEVVAHDLANRVFCNAIDITVCATLHLPDDDLIPLRAATTTTQLASPGAGAAVDLANYVADGCNVPRTGSLTSQIFAGHAYIAGRLVTAIPQTLTFPALSDCYRDLLPSGAFVVQSVPSGDPAPPLAAPSALRIGITETNASAIASDCFLCSTLFNLVGPDHIPKDS